MDCMQPLSSLRLAPPAPFCVFVYFNACFVSKRGHVLNVVCFYSYLFFLNLLLVWGCMGWAESTFNDYGASLFLYYCVKYILFCLGFFTSVSICEFFVSICLIDSSFQYTFYNCFCLSDLRLHGF